MDAPTSFVPADTPLPPGPCALVVAHPGHELRVHGWMERARPTVFVLTDGSGSAGDGRIGSTAALLERTGCARGPIFGRMTDRGIYAALLGRRHEVFTALADELAAALVEADVACVVADAVEGYNPSHDVCRMLVDAAVRLASRALGRAIASYDFLLVGAPGSCPEPLRDGALWITLGGEALARKLCAARGYPEMHGEVEAALARFGLSPFATECLRPVIRSPQRGLDDAAPFYERYGEKQVAAGVYDRVVRHREHVLPLERALLAHRADG